MQLRPDDVGLSSEQMKEQSQLAQLIANSTLIKSYEQTIAMYKEELDKKTADLVTADKA